MLSFGLTKKKTKEKSVNKQFWNLIDEQRKRISNCVQEMGD